MNLAPVATLLEERIGLDPAALGESVLEAAAVEHMRTLALTEPTAYAACLAARDDAFDDLVERLLVPETWFFRGGEVFSVLAKEIAILAGKAVVRILSVPCSTGEEPYSLAMALGDANVPNERWRIDAVDLSPRCIEDARRATYREFSFRQTSAADRSRYFRPAGTLWSLDASIRDRVTFRVGNLMDSRLLPEGNGVYDVILCRNLLIYLTADARSRALDNLERLLAPEGILGVGHAEPQILMARGYQRHGPESCFLYRRMSVHRETAPAIASALRPLPARSRPRREAPAILKPLPAPPAAVTEAEPELRKARRLADEGAIAEALTICRSYLADARPSAEGYSLLGILHEALGQSSDASEAFRKALYLDPQHREALTHAMLLSSRLGDPARAAALRERLARIGGEP